MEIRVQVHKVSKGNDGKVRVTIRYPGALNYPSLVFDFLPPELAVEFFTHTSKEEMDSLRGAH